MKSIEELKCTRCGNTLTVIEIDDDPESPHYEFRCDNCGMYIECNECPSSERDEYDFYKEGEPIINRRKETDIDNEFCLNCGHPTSFSGNNMLSDYLNEELSEDEDALTYELGPCPYCGQTETRFDVSKNDEKKYPYWKI